MANLKRLRHTFTNALYAMLLKLLKNHFAFCMFSFKRSLGISYEQNYEILLVKVS